MVCFQDATGNATQVRTARGKHYVLFDLPADKGQELKDSQPSLGWVPDINGHPTLPFSVAARLILPVHTDRDNPNTGLLAEYPNAEVQHLGGDGQGLDDDGQGPGGDEQGLVVRGSHLFRPARQPRDDHSNSRVAAVLGGSWGYYHPTPDPDV